MFADIIKKISWIFKINENKNVRGYHKKNFVDFQNFINIKFC